MRDYENTPRPDIEHHFHIRDLIESQEKRVQDRNYHRNRLKDLEEREDDIKKANLVVVTDFWCDRCKQDFKSMAIKQVEIDWSNPAQRIAFYKSKCDKGHWCMRLITDKLKDAFWQRSRAIARDRGRHSRDILQEFESGYNLMYKKR